MSGKVRLLVLASFIVPRCDFVLFGGLYRDVDLVFAGTPQLTFPRECPKPGPVDSAGRSAGECGGPD